MGQLLASTCKELPGPKESRRTAKELWEVVVQICSVSMQHKRNNDGRVGLIKHRDSSLGILPRYAFHTVSTFITKDSTLYSDFAVVFVLFFKEQIHHFHQETSSKSRTLKCQGWNYSREQNINTDLFGLFTPRSRWC